RQIGFTILSLTVSLVAVLIPLLFMGDVVGRLFREFAITLGVTILISAVVSLTLTPMMCARLLRHTPPEQQGRIYRASDRILEQTIAGYGRSLRFVLAHERVTLLVAIAVLVLTIALYIVVPKGFFPVQDTGAILGISEAPQSISFPAMAEALRARPELYDVGSEQQDEGLQVTLAIDRTMASRLGITPAEVDETLYDAFGQRQISTIFTQLNQYRVVLEVAPEFQRHPEGLADVYLGAASGGRVPLSAITRATETRA